MSASNSQRAKCLAEGEERDQILAPGPSRSQRIRKQLARAAKRLVVFLFSQVGLTCLVVGYAVMGGFVFMALEHSREMENREVVTVTRQHFVRRLWNVTWSLNILHEPNWTAEADIIFKGFQEAIFKAVKEQGWTGGEAADKNIEWTFAGSLLFAVTVITTIGYGHLTPRTTWGRIVLMAYALVGIPLTLLCLANIGSLLANVFRFLYSRVLCCACHLAEQRRRRRQRETVTSQTQMSLLKPFATPPGGPPHGGAPPGGHGDSQDGSNVMSVVVDGRGGGQKAGGKEEMKKEKEEEEDNILVLRTVPISVCLVLIGGYVCLGAVLFTMWEPDWDYLTGAYFCFVTLSTIGFGDVIPGHSQDAWDNQMKRVGCTLYLLFGLALIATCFELMQQQVRSIVTRLARFLGIVKVETQAKTDV